MRGIWFAHSHTSLGFGAPVPVPTAGIMLLSLRSPSIRAQTVVRTPGLAMNPTHRRLPLRIPLLLAVGLLLAWPASVWPQSIVATIPVAGPLLAAAVNHVTNKVYVQTYGGIVAIDGATQTATTLPNTGPGGNYPNTIGVNESTNKIYVATPVNVLVIDGVTNAVTVLESKRDRTGWTGGESCNQQDICCRWWHRRHYASSHVARVPHRVDRWCDQCDHDDHRP